MKKLLYVFLLLFLLSLTGCQTNTAKSEMIKNVNGVSMVSVQEAAELLGLSYIPAQDGFILKQEQISLNFSFHKPYVIKDRYIMYVMETPAVEDNGTAYLPRRLFSDYFQVEVKMNQQNQLTISKGANFSLYNVVKFLPSEVKKALNQSSDPSLNKIRKAVELPRSMNIRIPKLNGDKIIQTTSLVEYNYIFIEELKKHGYSENEIAGFSYNDYSVIEDSWRLSADMIKLVKRSYPELKNQDLSTWTYGKYEQYYTAKDKDNFAGSFTAEQKLQLQKRGILLEDVHYLYKDFYTIDTIFAQPDGVLKKDLEGYYQFAIDQL